MLDEEAIGEVLFKLIGDIHPIQETHHDNQAYENQKKMMFVIDECIEKLFKNAEREDAYAYSAERIRDDASDWLSNLASYIYNRLNDSCNNKVKPPSGERLPNQETAKHGDVFLLEY